MLYIVFIESYIEILGWVQSLKLGFPRTLLISVVDSDMNYQSLLLPTIAHERTHIRFKVREVLFRYSPRLPVFRLDVHQDEGGSIGL